MNYYNLQEINISDNIKTISPLAFYCCTNLKRIYIPNSVKKIGSRCFFNCINLEEVILSENLEKINNYTFFNCKKLKTINIPKKVVKIGKYAFYNCSNLKQVNYQQLNEDFLIQINEHIIDEHKKFKTVEQLFLQNNNVKEKLLYFGKCKLQGINYQNEYEYFLEYCLKDNFINGLIKFNFKKENNYDTNYEKVEKINIKKQAEFIPWYLMNDNNLKKNSVQQNDSISNDLIDYNNIELWMNGDIMPKSYVKRLNLKK